MLKKPNKLLIQIAFVLVSVGGLGFLSYRQVIQSTREQTESALLLWNQAIGEEALKASDPKVFVSLSDWIRHNNVLIKSVEKASSESRLTPNILEHNFFIPVFFHGAELFTVDVELNKNELIQQTFLSPIVLGGMIVLLLVIFGVNLILLRNRRREEKLEAEMQLREEKLRWSRQVAHDLRQPLSCLRVISQTLGSQDTQDAVLLNQTIERIEQTAGDLLRSKKSEPAELGATSLRTVALEIVDEFKKTYPRVDWHLSGELLGNKELGLVPLKKVKLQRVISNVLSNAAEVTKAGQAIYLGASLRDEYLVFECIDEGPGFEENVLAMIGKQEISTKKNGNGLGLYDISSLMNHLGGKIQIESQKGIGSRVQLVFPCI